MQAQVLATTADMSHDEWLKARKKGIGGSDASAIAGLNKWRSPIQVYMEKMDEIPDIPPGNEEAIYWGHVMEDIVAREFTERTGMKVRKRNAILHHPEHEWMLANVDRLIVGKKEGLECKTASEYLKQQWTDDEVPVAYLLQCQHYMAVTGYKAWWIAVLVGGNKFVFKKIERDEELIEQLIGIEKDFWENNVLQGVPPEIDGSDASVKFLNAMYPDSDEETSTDLPEETDQYFDAIEALKDEVKGLQERQKEYENKIKQMIGGHEKAFSPRHMASWKTVEANRFDSKRFKLEHPELYTKFVSTSKQRRFTFKEVN